MRIIGLTGGIASGKSTVAAMLSDANIPVIDADLLSRRVMQKDTPVYKAIIIKFGAEVLADNQELDRKRLAGIIFNHPKKRLTLESIVHPAIELLRKEVTKEFADQGFAEAVYVVPLLFEKQLEHLCDKTIAIVCDTSIQIDRLMKRDNLKKEQAKKRLATQLTNNERIKRADATIENNGSTKDLYINLQKTWHRLCKKDLSNRQKP